MQFSFGLLAVLAASAIQLATASPTMSTRDLSARAPVPITSLQCDGDTNKCVAGLAFGDGKWAAQWAVSVLHNSRAVRSSDGELALLAPVGVNALNCDGDTSLCVANLNFGDGNWVAQWKAAIFHSAGVSGNSSPNEVDVMAPANKFKCDGDTNMCTAGLNFGDGKWAAQWSVAIAHA